MKNIRHVGLVVLNLDKALIFYRDLLGLKIQGTTSEEGNFISSITSINNVKLNTVKLSADDNSTRIELIELLSEIPATNNTQLSTRGFTHIALTVSDLDELYIKLQNKGIEFTCEPKLSPNGKLKITFCRDFEGNFLELTQEL
jgi:catechol 2,3-dioxygenase-like lactoylglutathione lyase family enzyme